jgi:hypothetical protein
VLFEILLVFVAILFELVVIADAFVATPLVAACNSVFVRLVIVAFVAVKFVTLLSPISIVLLFCKVLD